MAGLWCVNVGYNREELIKASDQQMKVLPYYNIFFQSSTTPQIELAATLSELTPDGLDHFFFANSGSEANDTVVRMARHYWKVKGQPEKKIFIGRTLGYHGSTLAATSLGGMQAMHDMGNSLLEGFEHIDHPHYYFDGGDLTEEEYGLQAAQRLEEKIIELGAENVAAFIGEPIQGAGGVIVPPKNYWPEIQRICTKYNILLVVDEVICGFGRIGHWFGSELYGIKADIMPMAKGLSSGYLPISAVAYSDEIHSVLREGGVFTHGYTYSGHPVACAVALANIKLIKQDNLLEYVRTDIGPYFQKALRDVLLPHPLVGEIRGEGLMAAIQLVKNKSTRELFSTEDAIPIKYRDECLKNGLIMRAVGQAMIASPPLIITRDEVDEFMEIALNALNKVSKDIHF